MKYFRYVVVFAFIIIAIIGLSLLVQDIKRINYYDEIVPKPKNIKSTIYRSMKKEDRHYKIKKNYRYSRKRLRIYEDSFVINIEAPIINEVYEKQLTVNINIKLNELGKKIDGCRSIADKREYIKKVIEAYTECFDYNLYKEDLFYEEKEKF